MSRRWEETDENRKEEVKHYLKKDVIGLMEATSKMCDFYQDKYNFYMTRYITTSQASYEVWRRDIEEDTVYIPTFEEDSFFRQSCYGGRTYPNKKFFQSSQYDEIIQGMIKYDNITDFINDLDIVSLYPTAMLEKYPIGEPIKTGQYMSGKMGIYNCNMRPNKKLLTQIGRAHV